MSHVHRALAAMSRAYDIDQAADDDSAIGLCRDALRRGWVHPRDSRAFAELTLDETREIERLINEHHTNRAGGVSVISVCAALHALLDQRRLIREHEED